MTTLTHTMTMAATNRIRSDLSFRANQLPIKAAARTTDITTSPGVARRQQPGAVPPKRVSAKAGPVPPKRVSAKADRLRSLAAVTSRPVEWDTHLADTG